MSETSLQIGPLAVPYDAVAFSYIRASGPGGQNVNKVATAAQLRFDAPAVPAISNEMMTRLRRLAGRRMTADGVIVITARRFRSQERNRDDALDRLATLLRDAFQPPRTRRPTVPGRAKREKRMQDKRLRARTKQRRGSVRDDD